MKMAEGALGSTDMVATSWADRGRKIGVLISTGSKGLRRTSGVSSLDGGVLLFVACALGAPEAWFA